jgi:hypothetical protein
MESKNKVCFSTPHIYVSTLQRQITDGTESRLGKKLYNKQRMTAISTNET